MGGRSGAGRGSVSSTGEPLQSLATADTIFLSRTSHHVCGTWTKVRLRRDEITKARAQGCTVFFLTSVPSHTHTHTHTHTGAGRRSSHRVAGQQCRNPCPSGYIPLALVGAEASHAVVARQRSSSGDIHVDISLGGRSGAGRGSVSSTDEPLQSLPTADKIFLSHTSHHVCGT